MACLRFRTVISGGLTMLTSLISSSLDLLIAFLYMIRATVSYATYTCVIVFGLHPPCFHPGVSGLRLTVSNNFTSMKANECGQYSRHLPSSHAKLYKQKLAKRKLNEWFVEGIHKSHNTASIGISSGNEDATRVQVQWKNSIKVFPEDLISYHAVHEHESIMKSNCDTIDDAKDGLDYGKDSANVMQPLATHDCLSASESSIYQPFNKLQETDARPTDGAALVSYIALDSAKEHVGNKLDVYACRPPPSHGFQEMQEKKEEVVAQRPGSVGYEFDGYKMLQGMPCELHHLSAKLKEKLSAVRQTLHTVHAQLERQRTASSVAAQESMAMISMLQREKAALLLEAIQHQRMAEEKEMFDENAVIDLQDSLVKQEAELLTLEKQIKLYRRKFLKAQFEGIEEKQVNNGEANIQKDLVLEYPGASRGTEIGQYMNTIVHHAKKSQRTLSQDSSPDLRSRSMIVRDTSRVILKNEASELLCRLMAVEADRKLLRRTLELRRKERWEIHLLQEVAGSLKLLHSGSCKRPANGSLIRLGRACSASSVEAEIFHPKRPRRMEQ